jgi:two-component system cell cycle sensor histidine kinase/response regulator CckA
MKLIKPFTHQHHRDGNSHSTQLKLAYSFVFLCILVWINELVDVPYLFLGAPKTPANWIEALVETVIILIVGALTIVVFVTKRKSSKFRRAGSKEKKIWLPVFAIFFGLCMVFLFDEIFDIPSYIFDTAKTPINWHEMVGETIVLAIVGLYATSSITQYATQSDLAEDLFYKGFSFNPIPATITTISDGNVIQANDAFCNLISHSMDEIIGKSVLDLNLWVYPDNRKDIMEKISNRGSVRNIEIQIRDALDNTHDCLYSAEKIDYLEKPCILSMAIDITEHKQIEKSLIKAEQRYRHMFENTMHGVAVYNVIDEGNDFIFVELNQAAENIDNVKREDVVGKSVLQVFPGCKEFGLFEVLQRVWRTGISEQFPISFYRDERIEGWRDNRVYKLPAGEIVAVYSDETARMKAEEELRRSEEKFSKVFHASPDAISISTLDDGIYLDVNESFLNTIGYNYEEVIGRKSTDLGVWEHSEVRLTLVHKIDRKGAIRNEEVRFRTKAGKVLTILWSAERFQFGGKSYILSVARDVTDRKILENELRRSQKMDAVGRLASGITHDFSNLLTAIDGYCEMALIKSDNSKLVKKNIYKIKEVNKTTSSLIRQLLAFSRKQVLQPQPLDLNSIIVNMKSLLERFIGENIELITDLDTHSSIIQADQGQIEQIIMNLAINARDAMPGGGVLSISTSREFLDNESARKHVDMSEGEYVKLIISDNGIGMDEYTLSHVFDPFFTTKEETKGTGLGLSTVYGIVKQAGGFISLNSEPGKGTTFEIFLPGRNNVGNTGSNTNGKYKQARNPDNGKETILLVENNKEMNDLVFKILSEHEYNVLRAESGAEAVKVCDQYKQPIHLLITDVVLPRMSGPHLVERLSKKYSNMSALYISGHPDKNSSQHSILCSVVDLLQEPTGTSDLARKITDILEKHTWLV